MNKYLWTVLGLINFNILPQGSIVCIILIIASVNIYCFISTVKHARYYFTIVAAT